MYNVKSRERSNEEHLRMKKVIQYTYYILISISAILMLAGLIWGKTDEFSRNKQMEKMQVYPVGNGGNRLYLYCIYHV